MTCQRVLPLLSSYIDDELAAREAEMVQNHLSQCASCARELQCLQSTVSMLAAAEELETPAFLLEAIEAATTNRPTLVGRIAASLSRIPVRAQWASVAAAACALAAILIGQSDQSQVESMTVQPLYQHVALPQPTETPATVVPETPSVEPVQKPVAVPEVRTATPARTAVAHSGRTTRKHHSVSSRRRSKHRVKSESVVVAKAEPEASHAKPVAAHKPSPVVEAPVVDETIPMEVAPSPVEYEPEEVKMAMAVQPERSFEIPDNSGSIDELRKALAARWKERTSPRSGAIAENRKISVDFASIRF